MSKAKEILDLKAEGKTPRRIAEILGISKAYVYKVLMNFNMKEFRERFHNYSLSFDARMHYRILPFKEKHLRHVSYKIFKNGDFYVQFFKNKVIIRYVGELRGISIIKAESLIQAKMMALLEDLKGYAIEFGDFKVISCHNAFMGHSVAKHIYKGGQHLEYRAADGRIRTLVDLSKGPELEHEHPAFAVADSKKWEELIQDVALGDYERFKDTKLKLNAVFDVLGEYSEQIRRHLIVQEETLKTLGKISDTMDKFAASIKK